jgi:hypothetical protein
MTMHLEGGSIVVLIDCWNRPSKNSSANNTNLLEQMIENILKEISNIPDLSAVILATYESVEYKNSNNRYYTQADELFNTHQPIAYVRDIYQNLNYGNYSQKATNSKILEHDFPVNQLAMVNPYQIEYYIQMVVPHVKNIFFFGQSWNLCVKHRPIGYESISKLIKWNHLSRDTKLFTLNNCILDFDTITNELFIPELIRDPSCKYVTDNLFQIIN